MHSSLFKRGRKYNSFVLFYLWPVAILEWITIIFNIKDAAKSEFRGDGKATLPLLVCSV